MMLNTRILLQRSNLMASLALKQQPWRHLRQFSVVTGQNHLHFHQQKFKCIEEDRRYHHQYAKTTTGLILGNHAFGIHQQNNLFHTSHKSFLAQKVNSNVTERKDDEKKDESLEKDIVDDDKQLGLVARFKKMAKEYWYVLIPVHVITSVFWGGGFYYASVT